VKYSKIILVQEIKAYGGMEVYIHSILTSAVIHGGKWSDSRPDSLIPV